MTVDNCNLPYNVSFAFLYPKGCQSYIGEQSLQCFVVMLCVCAKVVYSMVALKVCLKIYTRRYCLYHPAITLVIFATAPRVYFTLQLWLQQYDDYDDMGSTSVTEKMDSFLCYWTTDVSARHCTVNNHELPGAS